MSVDDAIREHGFRRWYERQLGEGFALVVTGFLSLIMMAIALEVIDFRSSVGGLVMLLGIAVAGGAVCVAAWSRFNRVLARAEHLAERATCPGCGAYARFDVIASRAAPGTAAGCALSVRCRRCGDEWKID